MEDRAMARLEVMKKAEEEASKNPSPSNVQTKEESVVNVASGDKKPKRSFFDIFRRKK